MCHFNVVCGADASLKSEKARMLRIQLIDEKKFLTML
jgi:NAD-dependent DNA ligase